MFKNCRRTLRRLRMCVGHLCLAADLHFSNTLKGKRHVGGLYTSRSVNVDCRGLLPLAASPHQPHVAFQESCPCLGWRGHTGPVLYLPESTSPKNTGPGTTKPLAWEYEDQKSGLAPSLLSCVTPNKSFTSLGLAFSHPQKWSICLFWMVSTIASRTASLYNLTLFWKPRILLKEFHMNSIIMSGNPLKYIFEIWYIHC